jgi:biotin-dependent carboxylase-like uncharacterized protein
MSLLVINRGVGTTIQDTGRPGYAHLGVAASGAVDPVTVARVNRALGNPAEAAVVETAGGLRLRAMTPVTVLRDGDIGPVTLRAGSEITVDPRPGQVWGYLAVRGGIEAPPVLGSRSTDVMSGLGPETIVDGRELARGADATGALSDVTVPDGGSPSILRVHAGPRLDWIVDDALDHLIEVSWRVTETGRVGVRLGGGAIARSVDRELKSEGLIPGAIQVPASGEPLVMGRDHPTTGGYPVIAVVDRADLASLMQRPVGSTVRFALAPT